jgi:hypothetical protein
MIKYLRLSDEVTEQKEFQTLDEMYDFIINDWSANGRMIPFSREDIGLTNNLGKERWSNWKETRYVLINRLGAIYFDNPETIGMCSIE